MSACRDRPDSKKLEEMREIGRNSLILTDPTMKQKNTRTHLKSPYLTLDIEMISGLIIAMTILAT